MFSPLIGPQRIDVLLKHEIMLCMHKSLLLVSFIIVSIGAGPLGCGGASGGGIVVEGTLTEAGGASHNPTTLFRHSSGLFRHSSGQRIGNVEICALGECSTTDDEGQWGLVFPEETAGNEVLFTITGHGIDTTMVTILPAGKPNILLALQHVAGGKIEVSSHEQHGS
jgi:hypothetical protein